jgi:CubicO group peptidase (beta-lactamase class C family)
MIVKPTALFLCIILAPFFLKAQTLSQAVTHLLEAYHQKGQFDGSILIAKGDQVIFSQEYGFANRQFKVPVTDSTKFQIGSITKLYTTIMLLKLQEERKLNIDSSLYHYLPDLFPQNNKLITLKQLLIHVSGLPREKVAAYETPYQIRDFLKKNVADTLMTQPGTTYAYNNVNYILLGAVIEQVTHKKWTQVLDEMIIRPLGLINTGVANTDSVINNLAYGYHNYSFGRLPARPLRNDGLIYMENYATAAAIYTTPMELFKLHLALVHNQIITERSKGLMYTPETALGKVESKDYFETLGSYTGNKIFKPGQKPVTAILRSGNVNGFNAIYLQLPYSDEAIIILCNTDANDLNAITNEIAALLISAH